VPRSGLRIFVFVYPFLGRPFITMVIRVKFSSVRSI